MLLAEQQAIRDLLAILEQLGRKAMWDLRGHQDFKDLKDLMDILVALVRVILDHWAFRVSMDHWDHRDPKAAKDLQVSKV